MDIVEEDQAILLFPVVASLRRETCSLTSKSSFRPFGFQPLPRVRIQDIRCVGFGEPLSGWNSNGNLKKADPCCGHLKKDDHSIPRFNAQVRAIS